MLEGPEEDGKLELTGRPEELAAPTKLAASNSGKRFEESKPDVLCELLELNNPDMNCLS